MPATQTSTSNQGHRGIVTLADVLERFDKAFIAISLVSRMQGHP